MEICEYKGEMLCAYDVTNSNYALNYELVKLLRIAGKLGELRCPDCGREVVLNIKDPRVKIPHFSHKNSEEKCEYVNDGFKETEQHRKGKMILYSYLKEMYPTGKIYINHRFSNKRRSDIYCEFEDGNKLAIEYQRTALDILEWQDRQMEYDNQGIRVLWLLSGKKEILNNKEKQIEVPFFQQIMLNELEKVAIYIDVDEDEFILAKNMYYVDKFDSKNTFDELFVEPYKLKNVTINTEGKIVCDFIEKYNRENIRFIRYHERMCELEETERKLKLEKTVKEVFQDREKRELNVEYNYEEVIERYCTSNNRYSYKIKESINNNSGSINDLTKFMIYNAGSQDYKNITLMFKYIYLTGEEKALEIYTQIMREAVIEPDIFDNKQSLQELKCPYCDGDLIRRYGKYGPFVSCGNYPKCKFSFQV